MPRLSSVLISVYKSGANLLFDLIEDILVFRGLVRQVEHFVRSNDEVKVLALPKLLDLSALDCLSSSP